MSIYDFNVKDTEGNDVSLSEYEGKVLLIVNSATECGFTPQYNELTDIYNEFKDDGFTILDFPCNQFGNQAPQDDEGIHTFCTGRFGETFPQYSKIEVNGENADPLFKWLTENTKFDGFTGPAALLLGPIVKKMDPDYKNNGNIKWNFTKFLINREGEIVRRFEPTEDEKVVRAAVEAML